MQALARNPLYDRRFEHDACGLGLIARADGARSHELVERALAMLAAMEHRGARGADPDTGDGAGLMLQVPDALLRRFCRAELELELPPPGHYAVAMCFLPTDPALRLRCEELCVRIAVEEGQQPLGWRDVPRDSERHRPRSRARASPSCASCWSPRARRATSSRSGASWP